MMKQTGRSALIGSDRALLPGSTVRGAADPDERLEVTMVLRRRAPDDFKQTVAAVARGESGARIRHEDFAARFGYAPDDAEEVRRFAVANELSVVSDAPARRTLILAGTVAQFSTAFGIELHACDHANGSYRGRTGTISVPASLDGIVEAVLGLDNRPQAKPHFRLRPKRGNSVGQDAAAADTSYTAIQVADAYGFPGGTGAGQCIALIELGGGYRPADLKTYFSGLKLTEPSVAAVSVDHATNKPTGSANGPDGEVMLDIEVAGAVAPDASIVVYFAPNTDAGFLNAVTTAVHDTKNKPSIVSISWGGPESSWTQQSMTAFDEAFQSAATLGITVCIASGDNGSTDGSTNGSNQADFPASSSYALGCGGTTLKASGASIASEVVWDDGTSGGMSGGGVSTFFALPAWQNGLNVTTPSGTAALTMRGVPDVCGDADPDTGYQVVVDGSSTVIGGTSAVAPLWAGLLARINASLGTSVGYINPKLYATPSALHDIVSGNNGGYDASVRWDACTGLGSPNGPALTKLLDGH